MASSPLTKGLVAGKTTGLLGAGMTTNPFADSSTTTQRARALLAAHSSKGFRALPARSAVKQPSNGANGTRQAGGARISGGTF
jgi:hypothetical protein